MKRRDEAADGLDRERQALLQQLRGAEQACLLLCTLLGIDVAARESSPGGDACAACRRCSFNSMHAPVLRRAGLGCLVERAASVHSLRCASPHMGPACPLQVRFQLERGQEALQRQLLHAQGGCGVLEARLADAQSGRLPGRLVKCMCRGRRVGPC